MRVPPNPSDGARQLRAFPGYHTIRQGQDMQSIAWTYGRTDWQAIWDDSNNDALREACPEPMVLMPGERVYVPEAEDAEPESLAMSERHEFVVAVPTTKLRVRFVLDDEPRANAEYSITLDDEVREGSTDGDGFLEEEISFGHTLVEVRFAAAAEPAETSEEDWEDDPDDAIYEEDLSQEGESEDPETPRDVFVLRPGYMDPSAGLRGVQSRLHNLGYPVGRLDATLGHRTAEALRSFQVREELDSTAEFDDSTRSKLLDYFPG